MKQFLRRLLVVLVFIFGAVSITSPILTPSEPVYAKEDDELDNGSGEVGDCNTFLGLVPWYCLVPNEIKDQDALVQTVLTISANVFIDITVVAAYLVVGFVIYGGYLYIFSSGDPSKTAAGKKTLTRAFIGLAIVLLTSVILNAIRLALIGDAAFTDCIAEQCVGEDIITNVIQWVIGMGGIVAITFVVIGGISYITAAGDPAKLQKAKSTIIYALIGLAIVALSEVIVIFVSNLISQGAGIVKEE